MIRLFFLLLLFLPLKSYSQIDIKGMVLDSFTKTGIKAKVILMDDSLYIDSIALPDERSLSFPACATPFAILLSFLVCVL